MCTLVIAPMLAIACSNNEKETQSTPTLQDDGISIKLDGTQWSLSEINGKELIAGSHVSLYFRNGSVWGSAGCNIYGGITQLKTRIY